MSFVAVVNALLMEVIIVLFYKFCYNNNGPKLTSPLIYGRGYLYHGGVPKVELSA